MENTSQKLTEFFQAHLPLIRHMELEVEHYDGQTLVLCAPLGPNINDQITSANLVSLMDVAKANVLNPYDFMKEALNKLPNAKARDDVEILLAWSVFQ